MAEDDKVFDTTREDNLVFSFELGSGSVIRSWDIALKTMKVSYNLTLSNSTFQLQLTTDWPKPFLRLEKLQKLPVSQNMLTEAQDLLPTSRLSMLCFSVVARIEISVLSIDIFFGNTYSATLIFEVELVACRPRKGASVGSVSEERARLE